MGLQALGDAICWLGANAITLYFINNVLGFNDVLGFEWFAMRFVGGDFAALLDGVATPGANIRVLACFRSCDVR